MAMNIENFDPNAASLLKKHFLTENSKDINNNDIMFANSTLKRSLNVVKINEVLFDIQKSIGIEKGIFEYSLIQVTLNNLNRDLIQAIYVDKLEDILLNLDEGSYIKNKTFRSAVLQNKLNPQLIAFLSPDQLHPESWSHIINKRKYKQDAEDNMAVTDQYICSKCGEKKTKVNELQLRGADESTSIFVTCLVCYNTEII